MYTTTQMSAAKTHGEPAVAEPTRFVKRVGSTDYIVSIRFAQDSKETLQDKLMRLIENDKTVWQEVQND
jgi:hypothetical protein